MPDNETGLLAKELAKANASKKRLRACLSCGDKFLSDSPAHRRCPKCKLRLRTASESGLMGFR